MSADPQESPPSDPWWRGASIYQVYPRSFADSDDDGVGDLKGITAHLDHIASLGVDGVWLSPFFTSPMKDFGYDVADYEGVDPMFGTLADFDALIARAHGLGLKVVIDQVWSHTSDQHPWFQESRADHANPRADWYVWADARADGSPPSNWQSVFGGPAWTWDARRRQYYLHNFLAEQPDLNLHDPAVQEALLEAGKFWLERGVDGFRLDAINFAMHDPQLRDNPPAPDDGRPRTRPADFQRADFSRRTDLVPPFLEKVRALMDRYGATFSVAEVADPKPEPIMRAFTSQGRLNSAYGFNFLYAQAMTPALVREALEAWPDGAGWPSWAFCNHDAPRAVSRWAAPEDRAAEARLLMLLLVSLRGNIFIYEGEELGLPQAQIAFDDLRDPEAIANWPLTLGRDGARTPMPWTEDAPNAGFSTTRPWLPVPPEHADLAVDRQEADADSQLTLTRRLIALRQSSPALRAGGLRMIEASNSLLAFERSGDGQRMICVFNLGREPVEWRASDGVAWRVVEMVGVVEGAELQPFSGLIAEAPT